MDRTQELTAEQAIELVLTETRMPASYTRDQVYRSRLFWNPESKQNKLAYIPIEVKE